jgi:hypothetical protein
MNIETLTSTTMSHNENEESTGLESGEETPSQHD